MVDASWQMISVVGHLDLPKLYAPLPACLADLDGADSETARRLFTLLEMIAERNLALDVNLSGLRKGVGIYPHPEILRRARGAGHPRGHRHRHPRPEDLGSGLRGGPGRGAGGGVPLLRLLLPGHSREALRCGPGRRSFAILNLGMEILNHRFCPGEAPGDPAPLLRRRASRAAEGLPRVLVPRLLPRPARAQGGALRHDLRPHAALRRRGDRLPVLPPQGPARAPLPCS